MSIVFSYQKNSFLSINIYYNIKPNKISDKQSLDRKIITICGSSKFTDIIELEAIKLSLKGNIVLTPVLHIMDNINKLSLPDEDVSNLLEKIHKTKTAKQCSRCVYNEV